MASAGSTSGQGQRGEHGDGGGGSAKRSTERDSGKSWCSGPALKHPQAVEPVELQTTRTPGPLVSYTMLYISIYILM